MKHTRKRLILLLLVSITFNIVQAQKLHGIIFANTNDPNIRDGCSADYYNMKDEFTRITNGTSLTLNPYFYRDNRFTKSKFTSVIKNLNVSYNDIIICYITTHGQRSPSSDSKFPDVLFNNSSNQYQAESVHNYLVKTYYKAKLIITIIDACNSKTVRDYKSQTISKGTRKCKTCPTVQEKIAYKQLFTQSKGNIILSSSEPGRPSVSRPDGSAFTTSLLHAISQEVKDGSASWREIVKSTRLKTYNSTKNGKYKDGSPTYHTPIAKVNLTGSSFSYFTGFTPSNNSYKSTTYASKKSSSSSNSSDNFPFPIFLGVNLGISLIKPNAGKYSVNFYTPIGVKALVGWKSFRFGLEYNQTLIKPEYQFKDSYTDKLRFSEVYSENYLGLSFRINLNDPRDADEYSGFLISGGVGYVFSKFETTIDNSSYSELKFEPSLRYNLTPGYTIPIVEEFLHLDIELPIIYGQRKLKESEDKLDIFQLGLQVGGYFTF